MKTVKSTAMKDGDRADYAFVPLIAPETARTRTGASA
jgi:hypothetical protein